MKLTLALLCLAGFAAPLAGCAVDQREASAREWQRSECNRIVDREAREKCLKRID